MTDPLDSLIIRPGNLGDASEVARISKDWKLSFATSNFARFVTPRANWERRASELYWRWQGDIIERLLRESDVWVASWAEDSSTIVGWCVSSSGVVHYVYVGERFRRCGIARRLLAPALEHATMLYTHRTPACRALPIPPGWTYDPRPALVGPRKDAA